MSIQKDLNATFLELNLLLWWKKKSLEFQKFLNLKYLEGQLMQITVKLNVESSISVKVLMFRFLRRIYKLRKLSRIFIEFVFACFLG